MAVPALECNIQNACELYILYMVSYGLHAVRESVGIGLRALFIKPPTEVILLMSFSKKFFLSVMIASIFSAVSSVSFAVPKIEATGKIENATTADVKEAIDNAINSTADAITAIQNNDGHDAILGLIKNAKQASKRIESNRLDVKRSRANSSLAKARSAVKKDQNDEAIAFLTEALDGFKEIKTLF